VADINVYVEKELSHVSSYTAGINVFM